MKKFNRVVFSAAAGLFLLSAANAQPNMHRFQFESHVQALDLLTLNELFIENSAQARELCKDKGGQRLVDVQSPLTPIVPPIPTPGFLPGWGITKYYLCLDKDGNPVDVMN